MAKTKQTKEEKQEARRDHKIMADLIRRAQRANALISDKQTTNYVIQNGNATRTAQYV